jgi:hypothetical protein
MASVDMRLAYPAGREEQTWSLHASGTGNAIVVTDGLAALGAWAMYGALVFALAFVILRGGNRGGDKP